MGKFLEVMENWAGYQPVRGRRPADWDTRLARTVALVENHSGLREKAHAHAIEEAMGTADFPLLMGDITERQLIATYKETPNRLAVLCRQGTAVSFTQERRLRYDGADGLLAEVPEFGEYPETSVDEAGYLIQIKKYGKQLPISFEAVIRDNLGATNSFPQRLAVGARRTEEWLIANQLYDANGPNANFVGNAGGQAALSTLPLTAANIATAIGEMGQYVNPSNTLPILNTPRYLVVGPSLEFTARALLTSAQLAWTDGTGVGAASHATDNAIAAYGLQLIVDPWIPIIVTAGTVSDTMWMLISDPADVACIEFDRLRAEPTPSLWLRSSNATRVGGGTVDGMEGDFNTDTIAWRIRSCMGAARRDYIGTWSSTGA